MPNRRDRSDPAWDKRRAFIEKGLIICVVELVFCSVGLLLGWLTPEDVESLASMILAVNGTVAALLGIYMTVVEYGSIKKGIVVTEEVDVGPPKTVTKTTKQEKSDATETVNDEVAGDAVRKPEGEG